LPDLWRELENLLDQVPVGRVTTPGWLALALGDPAAAVWIGYYLLHHKHLPSCLCHRVVRAGGRVGPFVAGDTSKKAELLLREGIDIDRQAGTLDLNRFGKKDFLSSHPLELLRARQEEAGRCVQLRSWRRTPGEIGAVDVSYIDSGTAAAAYVQYDMIRQRESWSCVRKDHVRFPYVKTFLSFRELPLLVKLLHAARTAGRLAELILVDGSGILHPRRIGLAAHLGVESGVPTIGVTKSLLYGTVVGELTFDHPTDVTAGDEVLGLAAVPTRGSRRPIYASPGHLTDLKLVREVMPRLLLGHRLPEPLYMADRLSRAWARRIRSGGRWPTCRDP
jgi:deoxyribonuclease V